MQFGPIRRAVGRGVAVLAAVAVFTGCHVDVTAFRASVTDTEQQYELSLRDETRRPHEEEALVSGTAEELPRFRIDEIPEEIRNVTVQMLELELTGDYRGGRVELTAPAVYSGSFSTAVEFGSESPAAGFHLNDRFEGSGSFLRFDLTKGSSPVTVEKLHEAEIVFSAAGERSFRIEGIRFLAEFPAPEVSFPDSSQGTVFDDRLPVIVDSGAWRFTDLSWVLSQPTDGVELRYRLPEDRFSDRNQRPQIALELIGADEERRALQLDLRPGTREVVIRPELWQIDAEMLSVAGGPEGFQLLGVSGRSVSDEPAIPIPIEMSELIRYPANEWRREEFELFTWTLYPDMLWFDTRDYQVQARFFRRLAFFVEKRGFIGRLLTDEELQGRHGWNAHNYRPEGLADFFNAVRSTDFPINEYEAQLLEIILDRGVIVRNEEGRYLPGRGGVLSVSQESSAELRRLLIAHEAMHGVFYEEPAFRRVAFDYWDNVLDTRERGFWRDFFSWASYSPDDRYLMVNEFQAYLLQQSERGVRWHFRSRTADRLKAAYPQRVEPIDIFLRDYPSTFVDAGSAMNRALFEAAGMVGGDPYCLQLRAKP